MNASADGCVVRDTILGRCNITRDVRLMYIRTRTGFENSIVCVVISAASGEIIANRTKKIVGFQREVDRELVAIYTYIESVSG